MSEANTPGRAKKKRASSMTPRESDRKSPCREEQQGKTCSGNEPLDQDPSPQDATSGSRRRHDPEEQRPGSTEKPPGQ